ncbi:MAG TPA: helix-turn-helix domain-containing protein [Candidatus Syntrophosphaera sp.]|mgnify:CR=1 FL=1|nr:helix-turn-helix domain-containing protein [Candidatus Syntrophosphaera sp.]
MYRSNEPKNNDAKGRQDIPPGQEITARMEEYGWDQVDLAFILNVSESTASNIVRGRTQINYSLAEALSQVFGETTEYWIMMQLRYNRRNRTELQEIQRKAMLFKFFPVRELMQLQWIHADSDVNAIEKDLKTILGDKLYQHVRIKGEEIDTSRVGYMRFRSHMTELLWVRKAMELVPGGDFPTYNAGKLQYLFDTLRYNYQGDSGHLQLINDLRSAGVIFRILPGFLRTSLSGGLFWNQQNPVLIYTQRYDTSPPFYNFVEIMLKVCSRFRTGDYKDVSGDGASQNDQIGINPYTSHNGSFRIIDMDYFIGTGLNKPVDLSKLEPLVLSPGKDIPVVYHHQQSLLRRVNTWPKTESFKLKFPTGYLLHSTEQKTRHERNRHET